LITLTTVKRLAAYMYYTISGVSNVHHLTSDQYRSNDTLTVENIKYIYSLPKI